MRFKVTPLLCVLVSVGILIGVAGCSSVGGSGALLVSGRSGLARNILHNPKISLSTSHLNGLSDDSTAYRNILHAAWGGASRRSTYGRAPGGRVHLDPRMLRAMNRLTKEGFSFRVTEVVGGSHSGNSRHYSGVAFDVDQINGVKVGWGNPYYRKFMRRCREMGATEMLGPGDRGHGTHVHAAWSR